MKQTLLLLLILIAFTLKAQNNYEDVVYLKNGSIIHGVIIEQVPGVSIKIKNHSDDVFFYKLEEVEKMTKEEPKVQPKPKSKFVELATPQPIEPRESKPKEIKAKQKWAFDSIKLKTTGLIEIGGIFGLPSYVTIPNMYNQTGTYKTTTVKVNGISMFDLKITIDKMLNKRLSVGGGFGLDIVSGSANMGVNGVSTFVPVYFDVRHSFLKKRVSPYIAGQAGASLLVSTQNTVYFSTGYNTATIGGGALAALQFGMKAYVSQNAALLISLGYRFQHVAYKGTVQYTDDQGNNTIQVNKTFNTYLNYISLNFGVLF